MASYYYSRYYNTDGTVKTPGPSASNLGTQVLPVKATITTTHLGTAANRVYLAPIPSTGPRTLLGLGAYKATDMDTNGAPTLDGDIVLIYTINGVEQTPIIIVDSSALSLALSAAVAEQWIDLMQAIPNADAGGPVHIVLLINTAAATAAQGTLQFKAEYV